MKISYRYTILYVEDVPKTMNFFTEAFGFTQKMVTPEEDYGELETGETILAFASFVLGDANFKEGYRKSKAGANPFGIELAFTTQDVEDAMQSALNCGATVLEEVVNKPWGQKVGYLRDPNGFILEICSPMS